MKEDTDFCGLSVDTNVRASPDKALILEATEKAGFEVCDQGTVALADTHQEGFFEARFVTGEKFRRNLAEKNLPSDQQAEILASALSVKEEMDKLKNEGKPIFRTMDAWWAVLKLKGSS